MSFSITKLLPIPLLLFSGASQCQLYGSLELGVRSDSQESPLTLRHLGFINYQHSNNKTSAVFDYIVQEPHLSDSSISQAYIQHTFANNSNLSAGRFHRFDNLGYYTLDGAHYQHNFSLATQGNRQATLKHFSVSSYAGRPLRTDDIHVLSGDYVAGINGHFRWSLPSFLNNNGVENSASKTRLFEPKLTAMVDDISASLGYQALKIDKASQRINMAVSAKSEQGFFSMPMLSHFRQEFNVNTSLATQENQWQNSEVEDLNIQARFYLENSGYQQRDYLQLQYLYYKPQLSRPTFKQRFYSTYAIGKIALAELSYQGKLTHSSQFRLSARFANKQRGGKGHGIQGHVSQNLTNDWQIEASFDHLALDSLEISSIYAGVSLSPNALSQLKLQAALQYEQKPLYANNQLLGLQGSYQYMLNSNLFLSCSLELLRNSHRDNDHLGRLYLVYYFDKELGL